MGWFWQSTADASKAPPSGPTPSRAPPAPAATPSSTAADAADREIAKFWEMLQDEVNPEAKTKTPSRDLRRPTQASQTASSSSSSSWLPWSSSTTSTPTTTPDNPPAAAPRERSAGSIALSEASLPTTMSCRDAFDYAWHCHTAGSQWNAVYRYGGVRSCTELWDDFWFCMRTRSFAPDNRAAAIQAHYRAKEAAKYNDGRPNSEDVWESRDRLVDPGSVFNEKFDMPQVDDAQFQKAEIQRRREIRKGLGYEDKD